MREADRPRRSASRKGPDDRKINTEEGKLSPGSSFPSQVLISRSRETASVVRLGQVDSASTDRQIDTNRGDDIAVAVAGLPFADRAGVSPPLVISEAEAHTALELMYQCLAPLVEGNARHPEAALTGGVT